MPVSDESGRTEARGENKIRLVQLSSYSKGKKGILQIDDYGWGPRGWQYLEKGRRGGQTGRQDSVPLWKLRKTRMTKIVAVLSCGFWAERAQETDIGNLTGSREGSPRKT